MRIRKSKLNISILIVLVVTMVCIPAVASAVPYGLERGFEIDLPNEHVNYYFTSRTKSSNMNYGYVRLQEVDGSCNGINAWFCVGGTTNICSYIVHCVESVQSNITYKSNYYTNASVRLGVEDYDNTILLHHNVKGVVNYN